MNKEFADKVSRAFWLRRQAEALIAEADDLLDSLGNGHLEPANYPAGNYILKVYPTLRFDAATAKRNLTPEEFDSILVRKPDSAVAKRLLGEERYKATQRNHGMTRKIVPVEDEENA